MHRYILFIFLVGCAFGYGVPDGFLVRDLQTSHFKIHTIQRITDKSAPIKFYLEGDGHAFNGWGRATSNPTPHSNFMRNIAFGDTSPNVVYIARPCQFVTDAACEQSDWTTARFSTSAIESISDAIKQIAINREVILIGYSGGAQVAGLIAALHPEIRIRKLITIAGNLNHPAWTRNNKLPPLSGSLILDKAEYGKLPQIHYVGEKDNVIPSFITREFVNDESKIIIVPNATHGTGFEQIYELIWNEK